MNKKCPKCKSKMASRTRTQLVKGNAASVQVWECPNCGHRQQGAVMRLAR